jgi:CxxC motif-containing protein (DUF1111 family)
MMAEFFESGRGKKWLKIFLFTTCTGIFGLAQTDPGPRKGPSGAGGYYPSLNSNEQSIFTQALSRFLEVDSVTGTLESGVGLGPAYNGNSCAMCHAQPATGGSSPGLKSPQNPAPNPQVAVATLHGARNILPSFITADGPVREARFISDGGVHDLFTIAGRSDAGGCNVAQPNFAQALSSNNVIFRIPTALFGLGLVEGTPDAGLQANLAANQMLKSSLGISGKLNTIANDGTVMRFGWKAQNKSLLIFAGEAYNVEQGVSNEVFPNERSAVQGCVFNTTPEDTTNISVNGNASATGSDVINFALFARLTAPPAPTTASTSEKNGQSLFSSVGCVLCHTSSLTSGASPYTGMGGVTYHPYSDFAVHHMGSNLADGITQGAAGPDEFRTAPLWGVGQRLFFLHDGRTSDLLEAIDAHDCGDSQHSTGPQQGGNCESEASKVIGQFRALSASQKQDILNFLRSL